MGPSAAEIIHTKLISGFVYLRMAKKFIPSSQLLELLLFAFHSRSPIRPINWPFGLFWQFRDGAAARLFGVQSKSFY